MVWFRAVHSKMCVWSFKTVTQDCSLVSELQIQNLVDYKNYSTDHHFQLEQFLLKYYIL